MEDQMDREEEICRVHGCVRDKVGPIGNAEIKLGIRQQDDKYKIVEGVSAKADASGRYRIEFKPEKRAFYRVLCTAFGVPGEQQPPEPFTPEGVTELQRDIVFDLKVQLKFHNYDDEGKPVEFWGGRVGRRFMAKLEAPTKVTASVKEYRWAAFPDAATGQLEMHNEQDIVPARSGEITVRPTVVDQTGANLAIRKNTYISESDVQMVGGHVNVQIERSETRPTSDQGLWSAIRNRTEAISFESYRKWIDPLMGGGYDFQGLVGHRVIEQLSRVKNFRHGVQAYESLKIATQVFLLLNCGVRISDEQRERGNLPFESMLSRLDDYLGSPPQLPYIKRVVETAFPWLRRDGLGCDCVLTAAHAPCLIELIKEYFLEEGMLIQTMNAITMRFQNVHAVGDHDPLANIEIDPLRPLGNILWGRTQDLHLLSVRRRAYEYMHQYGLALYGKATTSIRPADSRSKFLEAFHNLLYLCSVFFKEDNETTVIADGYPLLNALKEVHLVLAQGAHNQYGDLTWTARAETLVQQWIMAQPEIREFLQSRAMVPYAEAWMPQVDTMKTLQGWSDVTVTHFRNLAEYGERIILSIRFGDWIAVLGEDHAKNWARFFRPDIQAYLHAYRAVTGIDLTNPDTVDATLPGIHLQKRLSLQRGAH